MLNAAFFLLLKTAHQFLDSYHTHGFHFQVLVFIDGEAHI